ncbi:DUF3592 domain-containing protein [Streptomyces sp. NPDC059095]|uniref:DUF3592 domain-containing protein n=1 Tax=unclassified Streptomyces TaxID=2593676 RepID=UPI000C276AA2|nr:DUF3592 domain-containing protein [Streptomyces sp. CB01201]PJN02875.1 hypothetical protein CG740_14060 [Streptomyces sp. CB01201]
MTTQNLVALAFYGAVAVGLAAVAFYLLKAWRKGRRLSSVGIRTTARCSYLQVFDGGVSVHFDYEVEGVTYSGESSILSGTGAGSGQDVIILYDPARPSLANTEEGVSNNRFHLVASVAAAAVAAFLAVFLLAVGLATALQ